VKSPSGASTPRSQAHQPNVRLLMTAFHQEADIVCSHPVVEISWRTAGVRRLVSACSIRLTPAVRQQCRLPEAHPSTTVRTHQRLLGESGGGFSSTAIRSGRDRWPNALCSGRPSAHGRNGAAGRCGAIFSLSPWRTWLRSPPASWRITRMPPRLSNHDMARFF
jgi:hypothetical protein